MLLRDICCVAKKRRLPPGHLQVKRFIPVILLLFFYCAAHSHSIILSPVFPVNLLAGWPVIRVIHFSAYKATASSR